MRINARMDEASHKALELIKKTTGESTTEAIKHAIAFYAEELGKQQQTPGQKMRSLLNSDFVGCAEGPEDGSTHYKDYVGQAIEQKHDHC